MPSWAEMVAPSSVRNFPAGQAVHVAKPEDEYEPAGQIWQSSALSCAVMVAPSSTRKVPAGQDSQSSSLSWAVMVAPSSMRKVPDGQI